METRKVSKAYGFALMESECWAGDSGQPVRKCDCPQCHEILVHLAQGVAPWYCFPATVEEGN